MSFTKTRKTATHNVTFQIIGGVLVVVGVVSLWRGEKSILGVGILVGAVMLIAPSILKELGNSPKSH